jgi:hypothetical protein
LDTHVAKNATHVVLVVNAIAPAASGNAIFAISSVDFDLFCKRAFFHFCQNIMLE